jgi:hypothetical protein
MAMLILTVKISAEIFCTYSHILTSRAAFNIFSSGVMLLLHTMIVGCLVASCI